MTAMQMPYSQTQVSAWLRGLVSIALADEEFSDSERQSIEAISFSSHLGGDPLAHHLEPIAPEDLARDLGPDPSTAQNFLRTAVMVALADGNYSRAEDALIQRFCQALNQEVRPIEELRRRLEGGTAPIEAHHDLLDPVREWLDRLEFHDRRLAHAVCRIVPAQCPFERDVVLFGRKIAHIPAMCKINPLFDQLVGLRFRALSFLADRGEDVSKYC